MGNSIQDLSKKWYVLYTKARQEKTVAKKLEEYGLEVYCPLKRSKRKWSDRWKWVELPLFTSYCFVRLSEGERDLVYYSPGVVNYVFWLGKPAVVREEEIEQIKILLNDFDHESIEVQAYSPGDKVMVESGALIDIKGEIQDTQGEKIQLKLENLGMCIWVDTLKNKVGKISTI
ncbi:MAG: UpxY family transcription antiterminator [Cyclobacteriaceae bacterium]